MMDGKKPIQGGPVLITAAIVGGGPPRGRAAWQPADTAAMIEAALACEAAGAVIIHLHARDDATGLTTTAPDTNASLLRAMRAAGCRAVLNLSAGDDGGRADHGRRTALAGCGAEMVSLAAGSFNTGGRLYDNAPGFQLRLAKAIDAAGAIAELEVFDVGHLVGALTFIDGAIPKGRASLCLVFGVLGGMPADVGLLRWLAPRLPAGVPWNVSAQGDNAEATDALLDTALALGGHVRTGIEDSRWLSPGQPAASSAEQVARWAARARAAGRRLADVHQARALFCVGKAAA